MARRLDSWSHGLFTTILLGDATHSEIVRDALSDAGCRDIETTTFADVTALELTADLVIAIVRSHELRALHQLTTRARELPVVAICEERTMEAAFLAGATDCVGLPLRPAELVVRIRSALRDRTEAMRRANRERRMSDALEALQREKHDLERLVCVDALTGVANRRHALALLDAEWRRSARDHAPLGLVMIDLDCYHAYNEQYGHLGGDACLQNVTEAMVRCLRRPADFLGRYGGEEFMAVLPSTDAVGAKIVAERLRAAVEALAIPHAASTCARVVTITAGFAALRVVPDLTVDTLIAAADAALLRAKASGRNRIDGDAPLVRPIRVSAQRWHRYAPVVADPWYVSRIPVFLTDVEETARTMIESLRDGGELLSSALEMKASAQTLRLDIVERLADDLVQAVTGGDSAVVRDVAEELIQYVTHVQVIYRRAPTAQPDATTHASAG